MRKRQVRGCLRARVTDLERRRKSAEGTPTRIGFLHPLPSSYQGEKHLAVVRMLGHDGYGRECCVVEERPGPPPKCPAERLPDLCFTEIDMKICFADFDFPPLHEPV